MGVVVIIGAQWGDEGKGKVVDLLAESADAVVRYAGGPNAGHTLVVGDDKLVFRLVPSGVLHGHTQCILGQGMVLNATVLAEEIDALTARGLAVDGRLHVSEHAHLIMPYHIMVDELREASAAGTKIGTTKRGIVPCYEDKVGRRGVRTADLRDLTAARARVAEAIANWTPTFRELGGQPPTVDEACAKLEEHAARLTPLLVDATALIDEARRAGKAVMLEGAQGTLLDIDHGTYPYVTSSSATAGGACTGAGIGPSRIDRVIGISKAYTTRVGGGPMPTELDDETAKHLQDVGGEYGSVTGRPRRCGWLDLTLLRYAARINGLDGLAITKLDVLTGLTEVKACVAYQTPEGRTESPPIGHLEHAEPIYETFPGWDEDITGCRKLKQLPKAARKYLRFVEKQLGVPIYIVSVGPRRDETIVLKDAFGGKLSRKRKQKQSRKQSRKQKRKQKS
ncbi:MAG: adenylosuccinate synthase [Deltaproteobacteria bacterium]|nr:adenylosuccinate synthase [Deltaproteobacteria bacterium]